MYVPINDPSSICFKNSKKEKVVFSSGGLPSALKDNILEYNKWYKNQIVSI
jgi:hypothetical protein